MSLHQRSRTLAISEHTYRFLLLLYPAGFRREYEESLVQVFRDCCNDAYRHEGVIGMIRLWLAAIGDLVSNACAERISQVLRMFTSNRAAQSLILYAIAVGVGAVWGLFNHSVDDLLYAIPAVGLLLASNAVFTALAVFALWLILALALIWLNTRLQGSPWMAGVTCAMLWGSAFFFFFLYDLYQDWPRIMAVGGSVQMVGGFIPTWSAYLAAWLAYLVLFSLGGFGIGWTLKKVDSVRR